MVDHLIRCEQFSSDLESLGQDLGMPGASAARRGSIAGRRDQACPAESDPQPSRSSGLANQLHQEDFRCTATGSRLSSATRS